MAISQNNFASCMFSGEYEIFLIRLPRRYAPRNDTSGTFSLFPIESLCKCDHFFKNRARHKVTLPDVLAELRAEALLIAVQTELRVVLCRITLYAAEIKPTAACLYRIALNLSLQQFIGMLLARLRVRAAIHIPCAVAHKDHD